MTTFFHWWNTRSSKSIPFEKELFGYSAEILNERPTAVAFRLMDKMWKIVREHGLKNKGLNIWIYGPD